MRDLTRYPITQSEILGYLEALGRDVDPATTGLVGDMRPLFLEAAIKAVKTAWSIEYLTAQFDRHEERSAAGLGRGASLGDERPFSPRESCIRWNECLRYKQCLGQEICP